MKLTKLQRYTAYCIMLSEAERVVSYETFYSGLCILIYTRFAISNRRGEGYWSYGYDRVIEENFPELHRLNPDRNCHYPLWFSSTTSGWRKRIELLKKCIEQTHP